MSQSIHEKWMLEAIAEAEIAASQGEVPVGAVVIHQDEVIGRGRNRREAWNDPTAHAEILALREAGSRLGSWRLNDCALYVTLEPCPMCAGAIVHARISLLVYGASDPKAGACESLYRITMDDRLNHRVQPVAGVLEEPCARVLKDFFRAQRALGKK